MCQVLGRQRRMSVSSAAIRGRNACCLFPGSWADTGGSQSAVFEKAELECPPAPRPLSQPAFLSGERCWHANQPPPFTCSLLFFSLALWSWKKRAHVEKKTGFNGKLLLEPYKWAVELKSWVVKKTKTKTKKINLCFSKLLLFPCVFKMWKCSTVWSHVNCNQTPSSYCIFTGLQGSKRQR